MVGSSDLLVVSERVDIERLVVDVVSDISLSFTGASADLPRTLTADLTLHSRLTRKYQVYALSSRTVSCFAHTLSASPFSVYSTHLPCLFPSLPFFPSPLELGPFPSFPSLLSSLPPLPSPSQVRTSPSLPSLISMLLPSPLSPSLCL